MSSSKVRTRAKAGADNVVRLYVRADTPLTEISVFSGDFRHIASALEYVDLTVEPGVYKIRYKAGRAIEDQLVSVLAESGTTELTGPVIRFITAAPLAETVGYEAGVADWIANSSHNPTARPGAGARVLICVRPKQGGAFPDRPVRMTLHHPRGDVLLDRAHYSEGAFGHSALSAEVDPGCYFLRIESGPGKYVETAVHAVAGWQTQLFFFSANNHFGNVDLDNVATFIVPSTSGFQPARSASKLTEAARMLDEPMLIHPDKALAIATEHARTDPVLGLFLGQALRRAGHEQLALACHGELNRVLPDQPDVRALAIHHRRHLLAARAVFDLPPMFESSWEAIVDASFDKPALVGADSASGQVSERCLTNDSRLLWWGPSKENTALGEVDPRALREFNIADIDLERCFKGIVDRVPRAARLSRAEMPDQRGLTQAELQAYISRIGLKGTEVALLQYALWLIETVSRTSRRDRDSAELRTEAGLRRHLVKSFRIPNSVLSARLANLDRLTRNFG